MEDCQTNQEVQCPSIVHITQARCSSIPPGKAPVGAEHVARTHGDTKKKRLDRNFPTTMSNLFPPSCGSSQKREKLYLLSPEPECQQRAAIAPLTDKHSAINYSAFNYSVTKTVNTDWRSSLTL